MTSFRLISVAAAALLFAQLHEAGGEPPKPPTSKSCLVKMNEARKNAGLEPFKETDSSKPSPISGVQTKDVCDAILDKTSKDILFKEDSESGTFAFYLSVGEEDLCSGAVDLWMAYKLTSGESPPVYSSAREPPYNTYIARSLFTLFSQKPNPTIDCAVVECQYAKDDKKKETEKASPQPGGRAPSDQAAGGDKPGAKPASDILKECRGDKECLQSQGPGVLKSLFCVTTPAALVKGKPPYTSEQWEKVRAQMSSGKMYSITAATSFVLAASALWLSAF